MSNLLACLLILIIGHLISINFFRKNYLRKIKTAHKARIDYSSVPAEYHPKLWQVYLKNSLFQLAPYLMIILGYYYAHVGLYLIIFLAILLSFLEFMVWEERIKYSHTDGRMKNWLAGAILFNLIAGGGFLASYFFETSNMILPLSVILIMEMIENRRENQLPFYRS